MLYFGNSGLLFFAELNRICGICLLNDVAEQRYLDLLF
jgi:hypothetical protein